MIEQMDMLSHVTQLPAAVSGWGMFRWDTAVTVLPVWVDGKHVCTETLLWVYANRHICTQVRIAGYGRGLWDACGQQGTRGMRCVYQT